MPRTQDHSVLAECLKRLDALAEPVDQPTVTELRRRLDDDVLRVLVVGEANRGKSSVINALLGRDVLPVAVVPLTALATTIVHGADEHVRVEYTDGRSEDRPLSALPRLVTESGNPDNRLGLRAVTVVTDARLLADGVELVDTPGTGSVYEHNTAEARQALGAMDAAVFVLTADPPISAAEQRLLGEVSAASVRTFILLNKIDLLSGPDADQAVAFAEAVVHKALGRTAHVHPCSTRHTGSVTGAADPGFSRFARDFADWLSAGRRPGLLASVTRRARTLALSMADDIRLAQRVLDSDTEQDRAQVAQFSAALTRLSERGEELADLVDGEARRMLARVNASAAEAERDCAHRLSVWLDDALGRELADVSASDLDRLGRAGLAERGVTLAQAWRGEQEGILAGGLASLGARVGQEVDDELGKVREAARDLLGVELVLPAATSALADSHRFFYPVGSDIGQTDLLTGAVRSHLPSGLARRRTVALLRELAASSASKYTGRARADLQQRLADSARQLKQDSARRHAATVERLAKVLSTAQETASESTARRQGRKRDLDERATAVNDILEALGNQEDHRVSAVSRTSSHRR